LKRGSGGGVERDLVANLGIGGGIKKSTGEDLKRKTLGVGQTVGVVTASTREEGVSLR